MEDVDSQGFRVGVLADTHGLLRPEALDRLRGVRHILHAGDIGSHDIIEHLRELAPVTAIRGNVDREPWAAAYPQTVTVRLAGRAFHLVHDVKQLRPNAPSDSPDVVVFGHSHRASVEWHGKTLFLNPGSAGPRRFRLPVTLATITITGEAMRPEIHRLAD